MPKSSHGDLIWQVHHNGFGLIAHSSFILLMTFFGHFVFHWWCPYTESSKQCDTYTQTQTYLYLPVKGNEYPWNSLYFIKWKLAYPWWGSNQRSVDYIPSFITRHVSDHQSKACQYISIYQGLQTKELYTQMTKYEFNMSGDGHCFK